MEAFVNTCFDLLFQTNRKVSFKEKATVVILLGAIISFFVSVVILT